MDPDAVARPHDRVRLDESHDGTVMWLVMERGERPANAFTADMVEGMSTALGAVPGEAGCLVLRGDVEFSVGADLGAIADAPEAERPAEIDAVAAASNRFILALRSLDVPVVGAVNGTAAGGGLGFALACDVLAMHADAVLDPAYARIGLTPDNGTPVFLARALGPYRARELLFSPRAIDAEEARRLGLVARTVEGATEAFDTEVGRYAAELAGGPPGVHGATKALVEMVATEPLQSHLERERAAIRRAATSPVFAEGLAAFFERRLPDWPADGGDSFD